MLLMVAAGTIYGFGLWSSVLKDPGGYGLNQLQLTSLAFYANLGEYVVVDVGAFVQTFGTVAGMVLGGVMISTGYFCLWLAIGSFSGQVPFACLAAFCGLYGHGCGALVNACLTEVLTDFAPFAGYASGCTKAFFGLAAATMSVIYFAAFQENPSGFLLFLSVYGAVASAIFIPIVNATRGTVEDAKQLGFFKFKALTGAMAGLAVMLGLSQAFAEDLSHVAWSAALLATMAFAFAPFLLAASDAPAGSKTQDDRRLLMAPGSGAELVAIVEVKDSALSLLRRLDYYLLMLVLIISQGCGLMLLNSSAQILPAIAGGPVSPQSFVGMLSVFSCLGRLIFGGCSDEFASTLSRPWWVVAGAAIIGLGHLLLFLDSQHLLWVGASGIALGFGGIYGVQAALIKEVFGAKELSLKLAFVSVAALVGSLLFGTLLAGKLYDSRAEQLGTAPNCFDPSCFRLAFLVCACSSGIAACFATVLAFRTAWIYAPYSNRGEASESYGATSQKF